MVKKFGLSRTQQIQSWTKMNASLFLIIKIIIII